MSKIYTLFEEELKTGCKCVTGLVFTSINIDKEEN